MAKNPKNREKCDFGTRCAFHGRFGRVLGGFWESFEGISGGFWESFWEDFWNFLDGFGETNNN